MYVYLNIRSFIVTFVDELSTPHSKNVTKHNNSRSERTKYLIWKILLICDPVGMGVNDITEALKKYLPQVNRRRVTNNCKELVEEGLIWKKNRQDKYRLTEMAKKEPMLHRRIYRTRILKKIWELNPELIHFKVDKNRQEQSLLKITKFLKYNQKLYHYDDYTENEIELFKFATKIGATITYLFLQAVRPYLDDSKDNSAVFELLGQIDGKDKDDSIIKWIKEVINPVEIFEEFCKLNIVNREQVIWTPKSNSNLSMYEMNKDNFDKLSILFQNVFPLIHEKIQEHAKRQERESKATIRWYEEYMKSERKKDRIKTPNRQVLF